MPPPSSNVWVESERLSVRNIRHSPECGRAGEYWTSAVKRAIKDGGIPDMYGVKCKDYRCANMNCDKKPDSTAKMCAGHVWIKGDWTSLYIIPICGHCNDWRKTAKFYAYPGTVVVEEERADVFLTVKSTWKRFKAWRDQRNLAAAAADKAPGAAADDADGEDYGDDYVGGGDYDDADSEDEGNDYVDDEEYGDDEDDVDDEDDGSVDDYDEAMKAFATLMIGEVCDECDGISTEDDDDSSEGNSGYDNSSDNDDDNSDGTSGSDSYDDGH